MRRHKSIDEYCLVLGVKPGASAGEVRRAYLILVKRWHPDRFTHDSSLQFRAQEKLKEINEAYAVLRDLRSIPDYAYYGSTSTTGTPPASAYRQHTPPRSGQTSAGARPGAANGYQYRYTPPSSPGKETTSYEPRQRRVSVWAIVWLAWVLVSGMLHLAPDSTNHSYVPPAAPSQATIPVGMERAWRSVPVTTSRIDPKLLTPSGPDVRLQKILLDVAKKPVPLEWKYPPYKVEITEDKIAAWKQDHRVPLTMKSSIDKSTAPQ